MSKNPVSKAPAQVQLDPRKMTISEYTRYQSSEMTKFYSSLRTYKKSLIYLGGTIALSLIFASQFNKIAHLEVFGADNRGGSYLNLKTHYDENHYTYNRQFQRMQVLGEGKIGDTPIHSTQLIRDLGGKVPEFGSPHIPKRAPHEKFF